MSGDCLRCILPKSTSYDNEEVSSSIMTRLSSVGAVSDYESMSRKQSSPDDEGFFKPINLSVSCSVNQESGDSSLRSDTTKVDLPYYDDHDDSLNLTTVTLRKCKQQVLRPYWRLLVLIGWRGFGRESINPTGFKWRLLNSFHLLLVLTLILFCYVYEAISCGWKLDLVADTKSLPVTLSPVVTSPSPHPTCIHNCTADLDNAASWLGLRGLNAPNGTDAGKDSLPSFIIRPSVTLACQHLITTYVVPNFLHFVAYVIGFFYFRIQENEQLYALMEKVFLQAAPLQGRMVSQSNMIRRMRAFLCVGVIWTSLTLLLHVLYAVAFDVKTSYYPEKLISSDLTYLPWLLFGLRLVGTLITSGVSVAVVLNYAAQCEMLTFFIHGIQMRLQERSVHIKYAMKDILAVRQSLGQLNGPMARMTSILVITFAEMILIGFSILVMNEINCAWVWSYRSMFPLIWFIPFIFPLLQAARCNSACSKFRRIALETRVFGYQDCTAPELDSFLLFVVHARLRATLFHIPIRASYLIVAAVLTIVALIILIQIGVIQIGASLIV